MRYGHTQKRAAVEERREDEDEEGARGRECGGREKRDKRERRTTLATTEQQQRQQQQQQMVRMTAQLIRKASNPSMCKACRSAAQREKAREGRDVAFSSWRGAHTTRRVRGSSAAARRAVITAAILSTSGVSLSNEEEKDKGARSKVTFGVDNS